MKVRVEARQAVQVSEVCSLLVVLVERIPRDS